MDKAWMMLLGAVVFASMSGCTPRTVSTEEAARAMGANDLHSIFYAGSGIQGGLYLQGPGQVRGAFEPGGPWPRGSMDAYEVLIDYQTPREAVGGSVVAGRAPPRGGGSQPIRGQPEATQFLSSEYAWNESPSGAA